MLKNGDIAGRAGIPLASADALKRAGHALEQAGMGALRAFQPAKLPAWTNSPMPRRPLGSSRACSGSGNSVLSARRPIAGFDAEAFGHGKLDPRPVEINTQAAPASKLWLCDGMGSLAPGTGRQRIGQDIDQHRRMLHPTLVERQ